MQSVNLLSNFDNQSYYILILLIIKAAKEEFSGISNTKAKAKDSKEVRIATSNKIGEECNNNENSNVNYNDNTLFKGKLFLDNKHLSDNKTLFNSRLLSKELLFNAQNLLGNNSSDNKLLLAGDPLSKSKILLNKELILDKHKLEPTNKNDKEKDKIYRDNKDYNTYEEEGYKECLRCKECQKCKKCKKCGEYKKYKCEKCDSNLQDVIKQHKHLKHFAKYKRAKKARDIIKLESEPKHNKSVRGQAFNIDY
jgi:hypothetical protein